MASKSIYVIVPRQEEFADVHGAIRDAVRIAMRATNHELILADVDRNTASAPSIEHAVRQMIDEASLVIADTSSAPASVMFELGLARAMGKQIIVINQDDYLAPVDLMQYRVVLYDRSRLHSDLVPRLAHAIVSAVRHPEDAAQRDREGEARGIPHAFVSYSHADRESLNRLLVHLKPLQRRNQLEVWEDTQFKAGDRWEQEISNALSRVAIAVLLISADFLASGFIIDNELPPLLQGPGKRGLEFCLWF